MRPHPRPRAVPEAPVEALLARADELAKSWTVALILARPLERIGEVRLEDLAREAPALCAQALRALESDAELERMAAAGAGGREDSTSASRLWAFAGARGGGAVVEAVEALRGVLWEALLAELRWPIFDRSPARQVADLGDRLAHVCATALGAALAQNPAVTVDRPEVVHAGRREAVYDAHRSPLERGVAVLVDEREDVRARPRAAGRAARAHGPEDWVAEGWAAHRHTVQTTGFRAAGPGHVPPFVPSEAPRSSQSRRTRARPLPWDTPPRAERAGAPPPGAPPPRVPPSGEVAEETTAEGGPVMRVTRGPKAPVDESA
jgi:hypothetical protein